MSESESTEKHAEVIRQVKAELDAARRNGDKLKIDLLEAALNDLFDNPTYHTYFTSQ